MNIVILRAEFISAHLAQKYHLLPDDHEDPKCYKIVVMQHVKQGIIDSF